MAEKKRRIGLFGGTFDPVHEGHATVARSAATALNLERVIFIPAADPPHKRKTAASFVHRSAMLELALGAQDDCFEISLTEAERQAPSYTVDTLLEFKQAYQGQRLFFIIGADSLLEIHLWYRYKQLFTLADFIVVSRPGISQPEVSLAINALPGNFIRNNDELSWKRKDGAAIFYLSDVDCLVSSSNIRRQLTKGESPQAMTKSVLDYIHLHNLYGQAA